MDVATHCALGVSFVLLVIADIPEELFGVSMLYVLQGPLPES